MVRWMVVAHLWCPELSRLRDRKRFWWSIWVANDMFSTRKSGVPIAYIQTLLTYRYFIHYARHSSIRYIIRVKLKHTVPFTQLCCRIFDNRQQYQTVPESNTAPATYFRYLNIAIEFNPVKTCFSTGLNSMAILKRVLMLNYKPKRVGRI